MILRGSMVGVVVGTGDSGDSSWNIERNIGWNFPALVGTVESDTEVSVVVEQSNDGTNVAFSEVVSNVPGNATLAAGSTGAFRFSRVAPYVRVKISNSSGGDATVSGYVYGSN